MVRRGWAGVGAEAGKVGGRQVRGREVGRSKGVVHRCGGRGGVGGGGMGVGGGRGARVRGSGSSR